MTKISARRATAAILTTLLTVALLALPAMPALGTPPEAATRTLDLAGLAAGGDDSLRTMQALPGSEAWRVGAPVPAGDAVLVGADWGGVDDVEVEVRAEDHGLWSDWFPFEADSEHRPDPGSAEAEDISPTASEPVWLGPSDRIQFRVRGTAPRLEATLVDMVGGDGLGWQPPQARNAAGAAHAATEQPEIRPRSAWGADETRRSAPPNYADDVRFIVVHHTAIPGNDYTCAEADDRIRGMYEYFTKNGWDDFAYNFVVDKCGGVWEGRAGGIEKAVVGGHASGWNQGSSGIVVIGNYEQVEPSAEAMDALDRLVAWKADVHHLDPHGTTTEVSGGKSGTNSYEEGRHVEFPVIIGHRTSNHGTSCPGQFLYDRVMGHSGHDKLAERIDDIGTPKAYGGLPAEREQPVAGIRPHWQVDFTEDVNWRMEITDDNGDVVRSTSGNLDQAVDLTWDLHDGSGELVEPGRYAATLSGEGTSGSIRPVTTEFDITGPAERQGGQDRYETALEISRQAFDLSERVVIASGYAYADALVATPLAGSLGAPVLLVPADGVPENVEEEIRRLQADTAFVIGGTAVLSPNVESDLKGMGLDTVVRLAGDNRYETAAAVADIVDERNHSHEVLVALGEHPDPSRAFPDALSAGAYGAVTELPVLLVAPDVVPDPTAEALRALHPDTVNVFGGRAAVSERVANRLESITGANLSRFAGETRTDTARLAAEDLLQRMAEQREEDGPNPHFVPTGLEVMLASGLNWPDALGAGAAAGKRGTPFLLTDPSQLSPEAMEFLTDRGGDLVRTVVAGGAAAVSDHVLDQLRNVVLQEGPHKAPKESWDPDPLGDVASATG